MLHLMLVRHGESEWNAQRRYQGQSDVPLSALGRRQAELIAERLAGGKIDAVYASDLARAWETARPIAEKNGLKVISEPRLRELKFGVLEGLTFDEAQAHYPEMMAAWLNDFNRPPKTRNDRCLQCRCVSVDNRNRNTMNR
jgi:broad specificity phosphatase PhoE